MNRTILMVQLWDKVKTLLSEKLTVAQVSLIPQVHDRLLEHYPDFPEEVVYDQDTTFLIDENYGKYHMTAELASYVLEAGYTPSFMMARPSIKRQGRELREVCEAELPSQQDLHHA